MILKIKHVDNESWWIFDELEKIRYSHKSNEYQIVGTEADSENGVTDISILTKNDKEIIPDIQIINFAPLNETLTKRDKDKCNFVISKCRKTGEEKFIVFNTTGFILNDNGDTIEKIPYI